MPYTYQYPRPAITADNVIFGFDIEKKKLQLLLIKRKQAPFKGKWALPGGFMNPGESLETTTARELTEECGIKGIFFEQLHTFSEPKRDPREHVISVAFLAFINMKVHKLKPGSDASRATWFTIDELPALAFDHSRIFKVAIERLTENVRHNPFALRLLPRNFSLSEVHELYETILNRQLDKRNFRKKILSSGVLKEAKMKEMATRRNDLLYQFDEKAYIKLKRRPMEFNLF